MDLLLEKCTNTLVRRPQVACIYKGMNKENSGDLAHWFV